VNATVTDLRPSTRSIQVPALSRDERKARLEHHAEEWVIGEPESDDSRADFLDFTLPGLASEHPSPERMRALWKSCTDEYGRWADWQVGKRHACDLEPWRAEALMVLALDDLIDGTNFYETSGEI